MKKLSVLLAASILFAMTPAHASDGVLWQMGDTRVLLANTPCEIAGLLQALPEALRGRFHAARVVYEGQILKACWVERDDGSYFIIDETGDGGELATSGFGKDV